MILRSHLLKVWNFWPPFFFAGIKIQHLSNDFRHVKVRLKLRFWTANYVGTQYGGSMYSMTDPFYMLMLLKNLGNNYIVWDKSATITYLKPGKTDLFAEFILTEDDINSIKTTLEHQEKMEWSKEIEIKDSNQNIIAKVVKVIHIRVKLK
jgi:hypothetical protein